MPPAAQDPSAPSEVVLGVDLGTTNSVVAAVVAEGGQAADARVLQNDIGGRTTPSCVHLEASPAAAEEAAPGFLSGVMTMVSMVTRSKKCKPKQRLGGQVQVQVGEAALRQGVSDPANTVRNVKSVLGRPWLDVRDDPVKPLGCVKVSGTQGRARESADGLAIQLDPDVVATPEEIAAMLLLELKKAAEEELGGADIRKAVVAVPAYFNAAQRQAVKDSALLAGLEVLQLVNETTAAAIAYAHDRGGTKTLLVVDVGGGGGSVSVVKVDNLNVRVVGHSGTRLPGGEDFDGRMVGRFLEAIKKKHDKDVDDPRALEIIRSKWEREKKKLSRIPVVRLSHFLPDVEVDFEETVRRDEFYEACNDLFGAIVEEVEATLKRSGVKSSDVHDVVLVGASTRIPRLRELIQKALGGKPLCTAVNPDEAVAKGAALLAAKCVHLEREVPALHLSVRPRSGKPRDLPLGEKLPWTANLNPPVNGLQVEQGSGNSKVTLIDTRTAVRQVSLDASGLLSLHGPGGRLSIPLRTCLSESAIKELTGGIESQVQGAAAEHSRAEAKNALEDKLREELNRQIGDDEFSERERELAAECGTLLEELLQKPNFSAEEAKGHTATIAEKRKGIDEDRARVAAAARLQRALKDFKDFLREHMSPRAGEIEGAPAMAGAFQREVEEAWEWLKKNPEPSQADIDALHGSLGRKALELQAARDAAKAAAEKSRLAARGQLEQLIGLQRSKVSGSALARSEAKAVLGKCAGDEAWLHRHPDAAQAEFEDRVGVLQQLVAVWEAAAAEEHRREALGRLQQKMSEMDERTFGAEDVARDLEGELRELCARARAWLGASVDKRGAPQFERVLTNIENKRRAVDEQRARRRAAMARLEPALECAVSVPDTDRPPVREEACRVRATWLPRWEWLRQHPAAAEEEFNGVRQRVERDLEKLCDLRDAHGSVPEDAGRAAARRDEGEPMDVDDGVAAPASGGVTKPVMTMLWERMRQRVLTGQPHWLVQAPAPAPLCDLLGDQVRMLQCLADAQAVETLSAARAAGSVALLVDKMAVSSERELASLSARFVAGDNHPVERVLVVEHVCVNEDVGGRAAAARLLDRFVGLCDEAAVDWSSLVFGVSAVSAGLLGEAFVGLLRERRAGAGDLGELEELGSAAVRLDERVAQHFHGLAAAKLFAEPYLSISGNFSTVDALRRLFSADSHWHHLLRGGDAEDPFRHYDDAVRYLAVEENREGVVEALAEVERRPSRHVLARAVAATLRSTPFVSWLATFDALFSDVRGWTTTASALQEQDLPELPRRAVFSSSSARCQEVVQRAMSATRTPELVADADAHIGEVVDCFAAIVDRFQSELRTLSAVCSKVRAVKEGGPVRGQQEEVGDDVKALEPGFLDDLHHFGEQNTLEFDSLQALLALVGPEEWPSLRRGLVRVLAAPLLPAAGRRAADQLRAVLRAGLPADLAGAAAVLAGATELPDCVLDRADLMFTAQEPAASITHL